MTPNILLVGCGNIGSRHLQALMKIKTKLNILVVEPDEKSKRLGKFRISKIQTTSNVTWFKSLEQITDICKLVIIATRADSRSDLMKQLVNSGHNRFIVEKVVCQSKNDYNTMLRIIKKNHCKAWVNTPRRYQNSYRKIRNFFKNTDQINMTISAGNMGLGTNSIHYLDLFCWFLKDYKIKLNGNFMINKIYKNKRGSSFVEFGGTLIGTSSNGSILTLSLYPDLKLPLILNIFGKDKHLVINETDNKIRDESISNKMPFLFTSGNVSDLTTRIVDDILKIDDCNLPTLEDSSIPHFKLFKIFNNHLKKITNKMPSKCPIT